MSSVLRYGSARLFSSVVDSPTVLRSLTLVNNVSFGFNTNRKEVKSLGGRRIVSRQISPTSPTVTFSYYLSDLDNERLFTLPVTSHEALSLERPLFRDIGSIDLAFAMDENSKDFIGLTNTDHQDTSIAVITNAYLTSYSFEINSQGIINATVSFQGDDILFKFFKNLSKYSFLESDSEDNLMTNDNKFIVNDGLEEVTEGIGGGNIISKINRFNFSADIPYRVLNDFGQMFHAKKVDYPFDVQISVSAFVDSFFEGKLSNIFCGDKKNDFIISNRRKICNEQASDEKSGMLFKGAQLVSQTYSQGIGSFLNAELTFNLKTNRHCGVYFTQHVQTNEVLVNEDNINFDHILLEDSTGPANAKIILEAIEEMFDSLKDFRNNGACSVIQ